MANQIATFFGPTRSGGVAGVQKHIKAFWTPKMIAHLEGRRPDGAGDRHSYVRRALQGGSRRRQPGAARDPGPHARGASDAG